PRPPQEVSSKRAKVDHWITEDIVVKVSPSLTPTLGLSSRSRPRSRSGSGSDSSSDLAESVEPGRCCRCDSTSCGLRSADSQQGGRRRQVLQEKGCHCQG